MDAHHHHHHHTIDSLKVKVKLHMTEYTVHVLYNNEITAPSNTFKIILNLNILDEQRCTKLSLRADPCR